MKEDGKKKVPNLFQVRDLKLNVQSYAVAGSYSSPRIWAALVAAA
jgi:hypothetical protein